MDDVSIKASQEGDIDKLYELIGKDAAVLKRVDEIMFEDTPLHVAASAGQTCFAMEVMNLMPSFARKLNKDGLSPMHLALSKGHSELVLLLIRADQELVRVKGKGGITPLHYAAQIGNFHLLAIFLAACPRSIEDVTVQSETVLHIAVKNNNIEALEVLVGWLQRVCHEDASRWNKYIPNWRDKKGDTVLDIAVSNTQIKAIQLLTEINAKNSKGLTALCALQVQTKMGRRVIRQMLYKTRVSKASLPKNTTITLANYLRSSTKLDEKLAVFVRRIKVKMSIDMRSALLVVAGVIIAACFQAVFSPPGSVRQENDNPNILINGTSINTTVSNTSAHGGSPSYAGKSVMNAGAFLIFFEFNSSILCYVICIIGLLLPGGAIGALLMLLLIYLLICYALSVYVISPTKRTANTVEEVLSLAVLLTASTLFCYIKGVKKIERICYDANKCPKEAVAEEAEKNAAGTTINESGAHTVASP